MSAKEINKYNELYNELVEAFVKLHNANIAFQYFQGRDKGNSVRRELRKFGQISKDLSIQCRKVCREGEDNRKLAMKQKREAKRLRLQKNVAVSRGKDK